METPQIGFALGNRWEPDAPGPAAQVVEHGQPQQVGQVQYLAGEEPAKATRMDYALARSQLARDLALAVAALVIAVHYLRRGP